MNFKILVDNLMLSVQLASVSTVCSDHHHQRRHKESSLFLYGYTATDNKITVLLIVTDTLHVGNQ